MLEGAILASKFVFPINKRSHTRILWVVVCPSDSGSLAVNCIVHQRIRCLILPILPYFEAMLDFRRIANLLAHNNISQICYCGQISLQSATVNSFSDNLTPLVVTFILLAIVHQVQLSGYHWI